MSQRLWGLASSWGRLEASACGIWSVGYVHGGWPGAGEGQEPGFPGGARSVEASLALGWARSLGLREPAWSHGDGFGVWFCG